MIDAGEVPVPLKGRSALVMGGSSGIGAAVAQALAAAGAKVAVLSDHKPYFREDHVSGGRPRRLG
ncbi:SDR family NAD(P)-dependent oxidoreductase [Microvirga yunnanensis]|uniref:SDR family NAD(P)-dependent oxidoreductase n=1 Tax=Microvirga yunnanensis TaxID=2953740 RepID=UPI0029055EE1|nr:SDR family NAD(P)-dependent oxidoreductase [Microvirga sp. HBU65207]